MSEKPKAIVRVHRPELTPEERAWRMKQIHDAAVRLIVATEQAKRKKASSA